MFQVGEFLCDCEELKDTFPENCIYLLSIVSDMKKHIVLTLVFCLTATLTSYSQSRGALAGEIYVFSTWYYDPDTGLMTGLFRTVDNGEHLSVQCKKTEMNAHALGDAASGVVYLTFGGKDTMWASSDYGVHWNTVEMPFGAYNTVGGCSAGEIYSNSYDPGFLGLWRSIDGGSTYSQMNSLFQYDLLDVGVASGEVFAKNFSFDPDSVIILYSADYGNSFTTMVMDTGMMHGTYNSKFTRGASPGEFYLVRMTPFYQYYIYHSFDHGQTLQLTGITQAFGLEWDVGITGGRAPGSFYLFRFKVHVDCFELCIDYSADYGASFVTYCHILSPTFTGTPDRTRDPGTALRCYPNPVTGAASLEWEQPVAGQTVITLFNTSGQQVLSTPRSDRQPGHQSATIAADDLPCGVYTAVLQIDGSVAARTKMIVVR